MGVEVGAYSGELPERSAEWQVSSGQVSMMTPGGLEGSGGWTPTDRSLPFQSRGLSLSPDKATFHVFYHGVVKP